MLKDARRQPVALGAEFRIFNVKNDERLELCTNVAPPSKAIQSFVTRETKTASAFESSVLDGLLDNNISAFYEPDVYALGINSVHLDKKTGMLVVDARSLRTPDFISSLIIEIHGAEKQVIFEPHDYIILPSTAHSAPAAYEKSKKYFDKMHEFKLLYPDFYTVMLSHFNAEDIMRTFGINVSDICSEFWYVPQGQKQENDIAIKEMIREIKARNNVYDVGAKEALYSLNAMAIKKIKRFESVAISDNMLNDKKKRKSKKRSKVDREAYVDSLKFKDIPGFAYETGKFYPNNNHHYNVQSKLPRR